MQDENTLSAAFHLAVLENSLDVLASALRIAIATSQSESYHLSEAPVALEEARESLSALKGVYTNQDEISPGAAA